MAAYFIVALALGAIIVVGALLYGLGAFVLAWAWNVSMPIIFGLPAIQWYHALALMFVASLLGLGSRK